MKTNPDRLSPLERLALVLAIEAPEKFSEFGATTYVRRSLVLEVREELTRRGVDWRAMLKLARKFQREQRAAASAKA